jgi:hypothetical protein
MINPSTFSSNLISSETIDGSTEYDNLLEIFFILSSEKNLELFI